MRRTRRRGGFGFLEEPGGALGRIHSGRHLSPLTKHLQAWRRTGGGSAGEDLRPSPSLFLEEPGGALGRIHFGRHLSPLTKHLQAWRRTGGGSAGEDLRPSPRLIFGRTRWSSRPDSFRPSSKPTYKTPPGVAANRRGFRGGGPTSFPAPSFWKNQVG